MLMQGLGQFLQPGDGPQFLEAFIPDGREGFAVIAGRIVQQRTNALIVCFQDLLDILPVVFQQTPLLLEFFAPDEVQAELEFTPGIKAGQMAVFFIAFQMTDEIVR